MWTISDPHIWLYGYAAAAIAVMGPVAVWLLTMGGRYVRRRIRRWRVRQELRRVHLIAYRGAPDAPRHRLR